jgi:hypothetical protein
MTDEQFESLMGDAANNWRVPRAAPLDEIWADVSSEVFGPGRRFQVPRILRSRWLAAAAVLLVGIAIGRATAPDSQSPPVPTIALQQDAPAPAEPYDLVTERYLAQTVSLLVGLPQQLAAGKTDSAFQRQAEESLTNLRLLMDSPATDNPRLHSLFDDLELVLVQVIQLPRNGSATDADLIRQAIQQRDVLPRLRYAAAANP